MTEQTPSDRIQRHAERMTRQKAIDDARIVAAQKRGLLLVNTSNGKGKSTASIAYSWANSSIMRASYQVPDHLQDGCKGETGKQVRFQFCKIMPALPPQR